MNILSRIVIVVLLMVSTSLEAKTYYVSCSGNDANDGTSLENPWASIEKVNRTKFSPGDKILFQAGCEFEGGIFFGSQIKGTAENPIELGSFGKGRAIINSGSSFGMKVYNAAGIKVRQIVFKGAGRTVNKESGIDVYMDLAETRLTYIVIDSVEVFGYQQSGISVGSWNGSSGFDNVRITNSSVHDNGASGISTFAEAILGHRNVYVGYNKVYNNSGLPEKTDSHSGNGIVLGGVDGAVIEYCEAYNNGWLNAWKSGGPVGIWGWQCNNLIIQYNESHHNKTGTAKDGGGFDIDGGCTNCVMQYNYSHDNEGPGYLIAQFNYAPTMKGLIVRYNISENDARTNGYGAIHLWSSGSNGGIQDAQIYNNTVYLSESSGNAPKAVYVQSGGVKNVRFYNNIFHTSEGLELVYVDKLTDIRFEGNNYWSGGGSFKLNWGGKIFNSLEAWREATKQEVAEGKPAGYAIDPQLEDPGKGGTFSRPAELFMLNNYKLKESSGLIGKGLRLQESYGLEPGKTDFWGSSLEQRESYSIGAHEYTHSTKACLYGGEMELTFGGAREGEYGGSGIVNGRFFKPEGVGVGNHQVWFSTTAADGSELKVHHSITVIDANSTEWKGNATSGNNWFDSRNWSNCVPTSQINAVIADKDENNKPQSLPSIARPEVARVKDLRAIGSLFQGEGTLEVNGNLLCENVQAPSNSTLVFKSNVEQQIPAGAYHTLVMAGAGKKKLQDHISISGQLDLGGNSLYMDGKEMILKKNASIKGENGKAYLVTEGVGKLTFEGVENGKLIMFPIGTSKGYNPVELKNKGAENSFSLRVEDEISSKEWEGLDRMAGWVAKVWHLEERTEAKSLVELSFQWDQKDEYSNFTASEGILFARKGNDPASQTNFAGNFSSGSEDNTFRFGVEISSSYSSFMIGMPILEKDEEQEEEKEDSPKEEEQEVTEEKEENQDGEEDQSQEEDQDKEEDQEDDEENQEMEEDQEEGQDGEPNTVFPHFFSVKQYSGVVVLNWEATVANGSKGIEVQVSIDSLYFHSLGKVVGVAGKTAKVHKFNFRDVIKKSSPKRYYRLKQLDAEGNAVYSEIKELHVYGVDFAELEIRPNPVQDKINFKINALKEGEFILSVMDGQGKMVLKRGVYLVEGMNSISVDFEEQRFPPGLYLLSVEMGQRIYQQKVIKK